MRFALAASLPLAVLLVACSSTTATSTSGAPATSTATTAAAAKPSSSEATSHDEHGDHHEPGGGHHEPHGELSGSLDAFHDILAPLWHGAKGDSRTTSTCAAVADLHDGAIVVDKGGPPANAAQPDQFRERSKKLIVAVDDLGAECKKTGRPDFEAKFSAVHDAFHGVMESSAPK